MRSSGFNLFKYSLDLKLAHVGSLEPTKYLKKILRHIFKLLNI